MTATDTDPIVWIDGVDVDTAVRVTGSKMGRLTELHLAGANVPDAFSVATSAYREHVVASGLDTFATEAVGSLGIVGPTRMDYPGSMASVRAVARYVSAILDQA